jgi:NTE family protein
MWDLDYKQFAKEPSLQDWTGPVGDAVAAFVHGGAHSGDYLFDWLTPLLDGCGVETFEDLRIPDSGGSLEDYQKYSLVVHASDLSRGVLVRLPWDYAKYGLVADEQRVVDAVRASMAIPFYFRPVQVKTQNGTATWVDGGLLANFAITVFDRTDSVAPRWPTWGVALSGQPTIGRDRPIRTVSGIGVRCLRTLMNDWDRYNLEEEGVASRTVYVDTSGVSATDFDITGDAQKMLFTNGRLAATRFLENLPPDQLLE